MKRTFGVILGALAAAALLSGLVHAVLVAAQLSEPAAATVYGVTTRRLSATVIDGVAIIGVVIGGLALARPAGRFSTALGRRGPIVALMSGLVATIGGGLVLAIADGGPGSGNGVVGAAGGVVLGLIALGLGTSALVRTGSTTI